MRTLVVTLIVSLFIRGAFGIAVGDHHDESKRAVQMICAAELYEAPLANCCKIPVKLPDPALKNCLAAQNKKTLKESEPMCTLDCIYKAQKWVSSSGVIDTKALTTAVTARVDKAWAVLITNAINNCSKQIASKGKNLKIVTGYSTKCNPQAYIMQNCYMLELYKGCPSAFKVKASGFDTCPVLLNTMSVTCGPFAHFTNVIADAAKSAGDALKKSGKDIKAAIPAEVKKVVNVDELGKVISQQASKFGDQFKQFKAEDMKSWFGK